MGALVFFELAKEIFGAIWSSQVKKKMGVLVDKNYAKSYSVLGNIL